MDSLSYPNFSFGTWLVQLFLKLLTLSLPCILIFISLFTLLFQIAVLRKWSDWNNLVFLLNHLKLIWTCIANSLLLSLKTAFYFFLPQKRFSSLKSCFSMKQFLSPESYINFVPDRLEFCDDGQRFGPSLSPKSTNRKRSKNVNVGNFPLKLSLN